MIPIHDDNPTEKTPYVTYALIALCVWTFFWELSQVNRLEQVFYSLGVVPAVLFGEVMLAPEIAVVPPWASIFSSMFLHGSWMHLLSNMLYLWIFGNNVEDAMGHGRFIIFYLLCGIAAALFQVLPDTGSTIPMIGASGAISGVLGAYLLLYPHATVLVAVPLGFFFYTARIPAGFVLVLWFLMQLLSSSFANQAGGVAFGAHVGGFLAGMVLIPLFREKRHPLYFFGMRF